MKMWIPTWEDVTRAVVLSPSIQRTLGSNDLPNRAYRDSPSQMELPGGAPFSLCEVSRTTDLFNITSVQLTHQPIHIDDVFILHIYGTFQRSFEPNATLTLRVDCGSHCEEYGNPPGEMPGESVSADFCQWSDIEQPTGGEKRNATCPPEEGYALLSFEGYVIPMLFNTPGWYNFTLDVKTVDADRIFCVTTEVCLRWERDDKNRGYPPGPWNNCSWPC